VRKLKISEIFYSIQGEGPQLGMPAVFIRTSGCNLDCVWCDSKYAKKGEKKTIEEIVNDVKSFNVPNIIITGGEPMIQPQIEKLIKSFTKNKVYIETNGTIYNSKLIGFATFIVSPKLQYMNDEYKKCIEKWKKHCIFKFVVGNRKDFMEILDFCEELQIKDHVYMMPKGMDKQTLKRRTPILINLIKDYAPHFRFSPRFHIMVYGNERGK